MFPRLLQPDTAVIKEDHGMQDTFLVFLLELGAPVGDASEVVLGVEGEPFAGSAECLC